MPYSFEFRDPATFSDDEIAEGVVFNNILQAEVVPDDPPTPVDVAIAAARAVPERYRRYSVRARGEGRAIVGSTGCGFDPEHNDNPDVVWGAVHVLPDHRRRGLGTQLLSHLIAIARHEGRDRIIGSTNERTPEGAAFASAIGAESKQAQHLNHLPLADVDRPMLERWAAEGPGRAPDYELIMWDNVAPEEHLDAWVDLVLVMNTAPRDDLQVNDFTITAEQIREGEKRMAAVGAEEWVVVARRKSDGAFAGFHNVAWMPSDPNVVWVDSTGVKPEHRGHALGKWLKAAITLRVLDERPQVTEIRTGNADSNDAMLGINKEMGYRPFIASTTWEVSVEKATAWLAERGVEIPQLTR